MVCFCRDAMGQLGLALPQLNAGATLAASADLQALGNALAGLGLPATPWQPNGDWLALDLPALSLSASAMATISAFAQLRADVLAQFGIDLLVPGQATGFVRLVATLNARLSALAGASLDVGAWVSLAAQWSAVARVEAALNAGVFANLSAGVGLGLPGAQWQPFLLRMQALLPLIAASAQLGLDLSGNFAAQLSAALRVMLGIALPALGVSADFAAALTAGLSAVAQLRAGLGIDPLAAGIGAVSATVAARANACLSAIAALGFGIGDLPARLGGLSFSASLIAPAAAVQAAMSINAAAAASMNWQVPLAAQLPVLAVGLPVCALTAQISAALGITASAAPCGPLCDASAQLRASVPAIA